MALKPWPLKRGRAPVAGRSGTTPPAACCHQGGGGRLRGRLPEDARDGRSRHAGPDGSAVYVPAAAVGWAGGGLGGVAAHVGQPTGTVPKCYSNRSML